ncbi:hypothetical protein KCTC52924_02934 [Arenibacter antarcticus]|uniref:Acyltransferase n=1 Tax=Arenibacter antarcticus TaxID=2040469 RepID=A0ABW5VGW8_9FLAO|nr:acyltransferase family protein [Arenibacter sp. H213]MCM4167351.1 hypothetical protein [Arenibacter sp. H213]
MHNTIKKERNIKLDLIRFSGVLIIMIAHSSPPSWLFQLRNFGTPLLILGSALTYSFIYKNRSINKREFFKKRLKRLIIPLWVFLTFFFLFFWIASLIIQKDYPFSTMRIFNSYNLYHGIGFVWIFKVYIILALITPFGLKISYSKISNLKYFVSLIILYLFYEISMYYFFHSIPDGLKDLISQFFLIIIPYSALFFYGLRLHTLSNRNIAIIIVTSFIIFMLLAFQKYNEFGIFIPTQGYKYPPTLYYLSYAFFFINLIYFFVMKCIRLTEPKKNKIIIWLSTNSLWIYLWHIFAYYLWEFLVGRLISPEIFGSFGKFLINTCFLLIFGVVMTLIQIDQVDKLTIKSSTSSKKALSLLK